ncbi:hypothetical protein RHMOL_Rhmol04G0172700 [Rhododendron molle]|uniref:Uncharacterized protein n=3 Tax=Rhododendron molle TaxID=49168 RepID=A0ACC0P3L9_RHOML|nr:hypothetical protein RHMOL_Rhmol04G0172700 [Rhododendron molle]KAI8559423.1 hypothetical protein RHMOL_Rhmol04G0172700 [Rhododendron molle]KAI8559424.1 hypothetical protein RHMOL_Rhmol04G0172700 [Rhododendron molle]
MLVPEERMHGLICNLIRLSKQRVNIEKPRHQTIVTSDVWKQILVINQKAREEGEKNYMVMLEFMVIKKRDDGRVKTLKANKDEDDKMRAMAANVAARTTVGGDDMLSKWLS